MAVAVEEAEGPAAQLIRKLEDGTIPISWHQDEELRQIKKWQAYRQSDKPYLEQIARWASTRRYRVDPLPKRISVAFADFLYSHDPVFQTANPKDEQLLTDIVEANKLPSHLRRSADRVCAEGEVYWRLRIDKSLSDHPIIDWWSRLEVRPLFAGSKMTAVAFIVDYGTNKVGRWRLLEVHEAGAVYNRLYLCPGVGENHTFKKDDPDDPGRKLGDNVPLDARPDTAGIAPEFIHSLPGMLAGRVVNEVYDNHEVGVSDYHGIEDFFLDLNEAHCIDAENYALAGKKRAVMPRRYASQRQADGQALVDGTEDILFSEDDADEMDSSDGPFKILEYTYESAPSIARKADLMTTALTRVGLALQVVDANADTARGVAAISGVALRIKLMPTIAAASGKAREWDDAVPVQLSMAMQLDALDEGLGGFGREYVDSTTLPTVKRADPIPPDEGELATRHTALVAAHLESVESAIEAMHPDWDEERVILEVQRILVNPHGFGLTLSGKVINMPDNPDATTDDAALANLHVALVGGEVESVETAIETLHTDWDPDRVKLEVERILADRQGYGLTLEGEVISPPPNPNATAPDGGPPPSPPGGDPQAGDGGVEGPPPTPDQAPPPTPDQVAAGGDPGRFAWGPGDIQPNE